MAAYKLVRWGACLVGLVLPAVAEAAGATQVVAESARQIPLAYRVDVVVVGGGTGAVAAAVAAAESGARVFLAAPYPYLGDDVTATLRLWLDPGEVAQAPLARRIFADPIDPGPDPNRIPFSYQADLPGAGVHKDTDPPGRLTDGRWASASTESVQYDGDVTVTADLGKSQPIRKIRVMAFRRLASDPAGNGFDVQKVTVSTSDDKKAWREAAVLDRAEEEGEEESIVFSAPLEAKARYLRLAFTRPAGCRRILLGEIELVGTPPAAVSPRADGPPPRPMHVKKVLDEALLGAKVQYLYSCYATDVLRDVAGQPCGVVMANRAGRQAVVAKVLVDATDRGWVARMAGARFRPYPAGTRTLRRVVIGGQPVGGEGVQARSIDPPFRGPFPNQAKTSGGEFRILEYALQIPVAADTEAAWAAAEHAARAKTYHPEQQFTADQLFEVPPDPVVAGQSAQGDWPGVEKLPLGACRPAGVPRLYLLGGCADVPRPWAEKLLRPLALVDLGTRIGKAAAGEARSLPEPAGVRLAGQAPEDPVPGEVRESLSGVRPTEKYAAVSQDARGLPVLGQYDVVVVGGGTGGAPAGIAAARQGAKTLVVEYLHDLGGVGTVGAIANYYWGNRVGFSATVEGGSSWVMQQKAEWWRTRLLEAGAEVWLGTIGCGTVVRDGRVVGAVVATPRRRGVVLAKVVIDATGNADVAAAAGAETQYTDASEFGMQGTGLPGLRLGDRYNNTDFTVTDETDMVDVWHVFVYAKNKYPKAFDQGRLVDTRERRRIAGDFTITLLDQVNQRTYPDTVVRAHSDFDTHGYTVDPYTLVEHPERKGFYVDIPYRAMLPAGLEGILVTGLGISAHRDAVPMIRMQADVQNGGYAAGVAAASAARYDLPLRKVDLRAVQAHLVEMGNLPASVLSDKDSYPLPDRRIAQSVAELPSGKGAAVVFAEPRRALPLVKRAYAEAGGKDKLTFALVLAVLGDATGLDTVLAEVERQDAWDRGWNYRGMGQYGNAFSPLDVDIVALGRARDRRAMPAILKKLATLSAEVDFSHHRAVALALELIGDPAAARPLAELLGRPGMSGHAHTSIEVALKRESPGGVNAVETRRDSLRELVLARALFRCGDHQGLGRKTLESYSRDLRGHLARHAKAVLQEGMKP